MKLTELIHKSEFSYASTTSGGEYSGPCPFCASGSSCRDGSGWAGDDRFQVWPEHPNGNGGRYWCRQCREKGDGIDFLMEMEGVGYHEAKEMLDADVEMNVASVSKEEAGELSPPDPWWVKAADRLVGEAHERLMEKEEIDYLLDRGLTRETIERFRLGFVEEGTRKWTRYPGRRIKRASEDEVSSEEVYIPEGYVIPHLANGRVHKINVRTEDGYRMVRGSMNMLFNADALNGGTVVMTEGEFDAMVLEQELNNYSAVATGGTSNARCEYWIERLNEMDEVILGFDDDEAGKEAARLWGQRLENSRRVVPFFEDVNEMFLSGVSLDKWIQ